MPRVRFPRAIVCLGIVLAVVDHPDRWSPEVIRLAMRHAHRLDAHAIESDLDRLELLLGPDSQFFPSPHE